MITKYFTYTQFQPYPKLYIKNKKGIPPPMPANKSIKVNFFLLLIAINQLFGVNIQYLSYLK